PPNRHPAVPGAKRILDREHRGAFKESVKTWEKIQEIRPGKVTLRDHCFEMPNSNCEAQKTIRAEVPCGKLTHNLHTANDNLAVYEYPGGYAKRFDGVDSGGGASPGDLQHIFEDNGRTAQIRMDQEAADGLYISATASSLNLLSGHTFELSGPQAGAAAGTYLRAAVDRNVVQPAGAEPSAIQVDNKLRC